jgi:hypothetical protein
MEIRLASPRLLAAKPKEAEHEKRDAEKHNCSKNVEHMHRRVATVDTPVDTTQRKEGL